MDVYVIGDNHFYHKNIIKYCNRPFNSVEQMNSVMIQKWNKVVKPKDVVIYLGDFALANKEKIKELLKLLNGYIIFISGNHDKMGRAAWESLGVLRYYKTFLKIKKSPIIFRHRPDYRYKKNKIIIHGHIHNHNPKQNNHINLSAEKINYTPIKIDNVVDFYKAGKVKAYVKAILEKEGKLNKKINKKKEFIQPINEYFR